MSDRGRDPDPTGRPATSAAWDRLARSYGYVLAWNGPFDPARIEGNTALQVEAALRTLAVAAHARSVRCVLKGLRASERQAGPADPNHAGAVAVSLRPDIVGASTVGPEREVVLAIRHLDDDGTAAAPFRNPVKRLLADAAPLWLDAARQWRTDRLDGALSRKLTSVAAIESSRGVEASRSAALTRTVLISMRWLDVGGAESFAIESMEAAVRAGFAVVVTCDEMTNPRLIARARPWAEAVYFLDAFPTLMSGAEIFRRVLARHRPAILHIQHSALAYAALPVLQASPDRPRILDTLHILEHRTGGYVAEAIATSRFIDRHHVVSHGLARVMTASGAVAPGKVRVGKLHDMSRAIGPEASKWQGVDTLRVVFLGRFTQQKRPYLFIETAARLRRHFGPDAFRFEMMGSGELLPSCRRLGERRGLADVLAFRPGDAGATAVLTPAHILLIPSDNEGLTLVAYEAMRADCLVVSCDVGAQSEIVLPDLLVPRAPFRCVSRMTRIVADIRAGRLDADILLRRQREKLAATLREPTGRMACDYAELVGDAPRGSDAQDVPLRSP